MIAPAVLEVPVADSRSGDPQSATQSPDTWRKAMPIFVAHGSPRVLMAAIVVAGMIRLFLGDWSVWDLAPVLAVVAFWPIQEWLIHVYILHFKPFTLFGRRVDPPVPRKHRAHHRDPWNYEILFIPFHSFVYSLPLLVALWVFSTPTLALAFSGITVHLVLALHYELIHFLIHTRVQPRTRYYQHLWRNHRLHHFKSERFWYGVTRTEGDWALGTAPAAKDVPTSPTCRTLLDASVHPAG